MLFHRCSWLFGTAIRESVVGNNDRYWFMIEKNSLSELKKKVAIQPETVISMVLNCFSWFLLQFEAITANIIKDIKNLLIFYTYLVQAVLWTWVQVERYMSVKKRQHTNTGAIDISNGVAINRLISFNQTSWIYYCLELRKQNSLPNDCN